MTPMKLKSLPWEETVKISRDWAVAAVETLANLPRAQGPQVPLRFIYMSGHFAPRERTEQIKVLGDNNMTEYGYLRVSGTSFSMQAKPVSSYLPLGSSANQMGLPNRARPSPASWPTRSSQTGRCNARSQSLGLSMRRERSSRKSLGSLRLNCKTSQQRCWARPLRDLRRTLCSVMT